jgi:DNA mismatch repair protein MutL
VPIQVLPTEVAAKIAAGEVVERPASVVKELVENSIDAGAGSIRIEARDGGKRLIRISDDGQGIPADEIPLAFARHATSKLTSIEDLEHMATLGFRGEALASVAAVSRLTLVSRVNDRLSGPTPAGNGATSPVLAGTQIQIEGGQQVRMGEQAAPPGTTVTVENLFYNVPARLKFLKAPATEAGHIHRVVARYALAYPEVRFHLTLNQRVALQTGGSQRLYDVLIEVFGLETARQLVEIGSPSPARDQGASSAAEGMGSRQAAATRQQKAPVTGGVLPIEVSGYASTPSLHRAQRDQIIFFVNRRWVQDRSLTAAVTQAYHTLLPIGRHPVAVINVTLDPADVDVNVHPTKNEVKFRDQRAVFAAVQRAVRNGVIAAAQPPPVGTGSGPDWAGDRSGVGRSPGDAWNRQRSSQFGFEAYRTLTGNETDDSASATDGLPVLRVVGQVAQTYVIAEGPDGLYLVDQHAAHERVLYEQLQAARTAAAVAVQQLLHPVTLELSPGQAAVMEAEADTLSEIGFEIEPFGGFSYRVRAVPEMLKDADPATALADILAELAEGAVPLSRQSDERLMVTVCKRAAIKAGRILSTPEMQALIHDLERCHAPRTCPHGRPTMLHLSAAQLAREFGRT